MRPRNPKAKNKARQKVDRAIQKACMMNQTHPYCPVCRPSLRSQRVEQQLQTRWGSGPPMLYGQAKCRLDQASTRQDFRIGETCVLLCPGQVMGELEGLGARTESQTRTSEEKKKRLSVSHVQCLTGPLLWVTLLEIWWKAERIRLKDWSARAEISSDVIPFVSIFGRIFNLMVPEEAREQTRNFTPK